VTAENQSFDMEAIVVLGTGRSGTSCVGGILHHLGVPMGSKLIAPDATNPQGFFEDAPLLKLCRAMKKGGAAGYERKVRSYVESRRGPALWGMKHPLLSYFMDVFAAVLPDFGVIYCQRPLECVVRSCVAAYNRPPEVAYKEQRQRLDSIELYLARYRGPLLTVPFDSLIDDSEQFVGLIGRFVGLPVTREALEFVQPELRRHAQLGRG
jgi:hypothetical protein